MTSPTKATQGLPTLPEIDDVARRMSGHLKYFQLESGSLKHVSILEQLVRRRAQYIQAKRTRQVLDGIGQLDGIPCANYERTCGPSLFQRVISGNVICVAVRVQNGRRRAVQRSRAAR